MGQLLSRAGYQGAVRRIQAVGNGTGAGRIRAAAIHRSEDGYPQAVISTVARIRTCIPPFSPAEMKVLRKIGTMRPRRENLRGEPTHGKLSTRRLSQTIT